MESRNSVEVPERSSLTSTLLSGTYKKPSHDLPGVVSNGGSRSRKGPSSAGSAGPFPLTITPPSDPKDEESCKMGLQLTNREILNHGARIVNHASYTLWNRTRMGMMLPGDYWFLTLTSSPLSPPSTTEALARKYGQSGLELKNIKAAWLLFFKKFWRKHWPDIEVLWVETSEAHGVIHAVLRFPLGTNNIPDEDLVRLEWQRRHKANQVDFGPVKHFDKTANYMLQEKNRTANEMLYQPGVLTWAYSRGWLPVKYASVFGRAWWAGIQFIAEPERSRVLRSWQLAILKNPDNLYRSPRLNQIIPGMFRVIEDYV